MRILVATDESSLVDVERHVLQTFKRVYPGQLVDQYRELLFGAHITVTSANVHTSWNFNYVTKSDTRVEGPCKDDEFKLQERPPMTRDLERAS